MSIVFDLAIIAIFALCIFFGYKKGLVNLVLKIFSFILALVVSLVFFKPVANLVIANTPFQENIKTSIISFISENEENNASNKTEDTSVISNYINNSIESAKKDAKENIVETVADSISREIINIAVLIILFIVLRILFIFIKFISNSIAELPIIKQFNKSGGIIYGIVEASLIIYIVFAIIALVAKGSSIEQAITTSYFASLFYKNNIIFLLFFK